MTNANTISPSAPARTPRPPNCATLSAGRSPRLLERSKPTAASAARAATDQTDRLPRQPANHQVNSTHDTSTDNEDAEDLVEH